MFHFRYYPWLKNYLIGLPIQVLFLKSSFYYMLLILFLWVEKGFYFPSLLLEIYFLRIVVTIVIGLLFIKVHFSPKYIHISLNKGNNTKD